MVGKIGKLDQNDALVNNQTFLQRISSFRGFQSVSVVTKGDCYVVTLVCRQFRISRQRFDVLFEDISERETLRDPGHCYWENMRNDEHGGCA
jgi:hypothetical protein